MPRCRCCCLIRSRGKPNQGFPLEPEDGEGMVRGHDHASKEVTAPVGVAVVGTGRSRAGISPGP